VRKFSLKATAWKWLIVGHRWLGVGTCLLFALWFATGLVMMYVGFPEYTREDRLSRLEPLDWQQVRISPERVLHGLALGEFPRDFHLEMMLGEPVYRISAAGWPLQTVSASTGRMIENVDAQTARAVVERATGEKVAYVETLERDQWTVTEAFTAHRPLHRVVLEDERGLELYVSSRTGEIVLDTTARERGWNWAGAVLHWLYFTELRAKPTLWSRVVLWTSGVCIVVAITGLWLGIDRLRIRRRSGNASITPFRGWMAWHHVAGVIGGVFVLTWIFSGWLSMEPQVPWSRELDPRRPAAASLTLAGTNEPEFPASMEALAALQGADAREAALMWALDAPQIVLTNGEGERTVIDARSGEPRAFSDEMLRARAAYAVPRAALAASERLVHEDAYWYSRRGTPTLPVLRFKFDDEEQTWMHVDPTTGRLVGWLRKSDRMQRWLFNGLHSFDFRWLLAHRPAWDVLMWVLSIAGLTICTTSIVIAVRVLRR